MFGLASFTNNVMLVKQTQISETYHHPSSYVTQHQNFQVWFNKLLWGVEETE